MPPLPHLPADCALPLQTNLHAPCALCLCRYIYMPPVAYAPVCRTLYASVCPVPLQVDLPSISHKINQTYRQYNMSQAPVLVLNFTLPTDSYDVNVTPNKRTLLLHNGRQIEATVPMPCANIVGTVGTVGTCSFPLYGMSLCNTHALYHIPLCHLPPCTCPLCHMPLCALCHCCVLCHSHALDGGVHCAPDLGVHCAPPRPVVPACTDCLRCGRSHRDR